MLQSARELSLSKGAFVSCAQDKVTIKKWIEAADRKVKDGARSANSFDTRMEAYYDAAFNLALVVVNAQGWKTKSGVGHHEHTLEAACSAVGASEGLHARLDAIRLLRNLKYTGAARTQQDVDVARKAHEEFSAFVIDWLQKKHAGLLQS